MWSIQRLVRMAVAITGTIVTYQLRVPSHRRFLVSAAHIAHIARVRLLTLMRTGNDTVHSKDHLEFVTTYFIGNPPFPSYPVLHGLHALHFVALFVALW